MKHEKISQFSPCEDGLDFFISQKSYTQAWINCERGDWMLWIANKLGIDDRKFTLAKAMIAKQVEHLMKDQRSKDALVACLKYANGEITREELNAAAAAAAAAAADAYAAAAAAAAAYAYAADAAYAAAAAAAAAYAYAAADAAAADAAAYAAAAYAYAADAAYAAAAARNVSLKRSADICREYLTKEVLTAYKKLR